MVADHTREAGLNGPRWTIERREHEPDRAARKASPGLEATTDVVLRPPPPGPERVLGSVRRYRRGPAHWLKAFGFVPGGRFAWVVEGVSHLGDRDFFLHVFPVDETQDSFRVTVFDELGDGDIRFAADGGAVFCRFEDPWRRKPDWIARTTLPPDGETIRTADWPADLVAFEDCATEL
jgi:hypothetical protein